MIFLEADLSQVESRIVYMLTGDKEMRRLARTPPWEFDQHTFNASIIFNVREEELKAWLKLPKSDPKRKRADEMRYLAKRSVHGAQRDMRGGRLSDLLLLDDKHLSVTECERMLDVYHTRFPAIRNVYFREIRKLVMRDRLLVNSWGRRWDVRYDRMDDELFRQAYSFLPQSENADFLNQYGLWPTWAYLKSLYGKPPNIQVHDSVLCSIRPEDAYDVAIFIQSSLSRPLQLWGHRLVVPVEFKLGSNWEGDREFKRLPSKAEFTAAAFEVEKKVQERLAA